MIPEARGRQPGALRVLVVDDNEDAAEMLSDALGMLGCDARVAYDGAEAIRIAHEFDPELALLDIGLPVMDGYELAGHLRRAARGEQLRLVAVTGYGQDSDRIRAAQAGFDAHLVKPVELQIVIELIDDCRKRVGGRPS